jgi:hypothetical protein
MIIIIILNSEHRMRICKTNNIIFNVSSLQYTLARSCHGHLGNRHSLRLNYLRPIGKEEGYDN